MVCKNCGGEIVFQDGIGVCSSCGAQTKIDDVFENTEVYICYTENDLAGRRVKDSLIANEIYNKFENAKINTFYERVSAGNLASDELEITRYQALYNAKVIVILATTPDYFEQLFEKNSQYFEGKAVLPVCVDMSPAQLPQQLAKYQASNYNNVGANADLIKTVLRLLGREAEISFGETVTKAQKQKKRLIIALIIAVAVFILGVGAFLVVNYYLNSGDRLLEKNYNSAIALIEQEKYLDAAEILQTTLDYKDSENQLKKIYDRYDGYYLNQNEDISLYLNVKNSSAFEIEVTKIFDERKIRFSGEVEFKDNIGNIEFTDNASNKGKATVTLFDDAIEVIAVITESTGEYSVGNFTETFYVKDKTDKPQDSEITHLTLMNWLSERTTASDLEQYGCELVFEKYLSEGGGWNDNTNLYRIANTDIKVLLINYDVDVDELFAGVHTYDEFLISDPIVYGIVAPAELLTPDKIGQTVDAYCFDGDMIYGYSITDYNADFYIDLSDGMGHTWSYPSFGESSGAYVTVSADTMVSAVSKISAGEKNCEILTRCYKYRNKSNVFKNNIPDASCKSYDNRIYITENDNYYFYAIINYSTTSKSQAYYYKADKETKEVGLLHITDTYDLTLDFTIDTSIDWENIPCIAREFGIEVEEPENATSSTEIAIDPETYFVGCHYDADDVNYLDITGDGEEYTVTISIGDIYYPNIYATYGEEGAILEFEHTSDDGFAFSGTIRRKGANIFLKITESDMDELPIDSEYKFLL